MEYAYISWRFLVASLVMFYMTVSTWACSCQFKHPQTHFCEADFVIKANVKTSNEKGYIKYKIRVTKVYKETPAYQSANTEYLYTPEADPMCGVLLKENTKYLISGKVREGKLQLTSCDMYDEWNKVPLRQRKGLSYLYDKNCGCKVNICPYRGCSSDLKEDETTCIYDMFKDPEFCYLKHSLCKRDINSSGCKWARPGLLKRCLKNDGPMEP